MKYFLPLLIGLSIVLLISCEMPSIPVMNDKPVVESLSVEGEAKVVAGPYVSSVSSVKASICFVTDRSVASAVLITNSGFKRTIRGGRATRHHRLDILDLAPGTEYECQIVIHDKVVYTFPLRIYPAVSETASIAILNGGKGQEEALQFFAGEIRKRRPISTILVGEQVAEPDDPDQWLAQVLSSEHSGLTGLNLIHAPDLAGVGLETGRLLFPAQVMDRSFVSRVGPIDMVFLAPSDLQPGNRFRLDHWLNRTLNLSRATWKVVILPQPLISSTGQGISFTLFEAFAPIFEKYGAHLVLSSRGPFYHRSRALGTKDHAVSYINLPHVTATKAPEKGSELTLAQSGAPSYAMLQAKGRRLYFNIINRAGTQVDRVVIGPEPRGLGESLDRLTIVKKAHAAVIQRRERRAIVRQAVRAVNDPGNPGALHFVVSNPSPLLFSGMLQWEQEGSAFTVSPEQIPFDLQPGAAARSIFHFTPKPGGRKMPILKVTDDKGQTARQELLLVHYLDYSLPSTSLGMQVDGRLKEHFWKKAVSLDLIRNLHGDASSSTGANAKMIAGPGGLRIAFRCQLPDDAEFQQIATKHDQPTWKDESVEVFIDATGGGRHFCQFAVSIHGVTREASSSEGLVWSPEWRFAVKRKSDQYYVELEIPYEALGLEGRPAPGSVWGINLTRNDYTGQRCEITQATPTYGSNAYSGLYLRFKFE